MVFKKLVIVDCKGHLMGRLASVVAKQLLLGQKIVLVRCEDLNISGSFGRNCFKFTAYLNKRTNSNPRKGPFHFRAPSRIMWKAVRGMVPHKLYKGAAAMARLKVFEGIPRPYDKMKRMVVPVACRGNNLTPGRRYTLLGRMSSKFGWQHRDLIERLEEKRKTLSRARYLKRAAKEKIKRKAMKNLEDPYAESKFNRALFNKDVGYKTTEMKKINLELAKYGY